MHLNRHSINSSFGPLLYICVLASTLMYPRCGRFDANGYHVVSVGCTMLIHQASGRIHRTCACPAPRTEIKPRAVETSAICSRIDRSSKRTGNTSKPHTFICSSNESQFCNRRLTQNSLISAAQINQQDTILPSTLMHTGRVPIGKLTNK